MPRRNQSMGERLAGMAQDAIANSGKEQNSLNFDGGDFSEIKDLVEAENLTPEQKKKLKNERLNKLAKGATKRLKNRSEQLLVLDHRVLISMNAEIVNLVENSVKRFDNDGEKGLDEEEMKLFFEATMNLVEKVIKQYAPTEAEIKEMEEAQEAMKEAKEDIENVEEIDLDKVSDDPGEIPDLPTLAEKFEYYDAAHQKMQEESTKATVAFSRAAKSRATLIDRRNKLEARKRFRMYFGMKDPEMRSFNMMVNKAKKAVKDTKEKIKKVADRLERYGEKMAEASNEQKRQLMEEEMKGHLDRIDDYEQEGMQQTKAEKKRYHQLQAHREALENNKADLQFYREMVLQDKKEETQDRMVYAEMRQAQLQTYGDILLDGRERVDSALENLMNSSDEGLTEQQKEEKEGQKQALLLSRMQLDNREKSLQLAQLGTGAVLGETQEAWEALNEEDQISAEGIYNADSQLTIVEMDLQTIDSHLGMVKKGMLEFTESKEEVRAYYAEVAETYDGIDEAIDMAIAKNNIATTQTLVDLDTQYSNLGNMQVPRPGWFESTIGVPYATLGGTMELGGDWILEKTRGLSESLNNMDRQAMSPANYWFRRVVVHPANTVFSFAGEGLKFGGGLVGIASSWENASNFGNGITSMIGLDFKNGHYGPHVAMETFKTIATESVPYEDIKNGRYDVAAGRLLFNLISSATGMKAVGAGKKAAFSTGKKAMQEAIESGQGVARAIGTGTVKGMGAGTKATFGSFGSQAVEAAGKVSQVAMVLGEKLSHLSVTIVNQSIALNKRVMTNRNLRKEGLDKTLEKIANGDLMLTEMVLSKLLRNEELMDDFAQLAKGETIEIDPKLSRRGDFENVAEALDPNQVVDIVDDSEVMTPEQAGAVEINSTPPPPGKKSKQKTPPPPPKAKRKPRGTQLATGEPPKIPEVATERTTRKPRRKRREAPQISPEGATRPERRYNDTEKLQMKADRDELSKIYAENRANPAKTVQMLEDALRGKANANENGFVSILNNLKQRDPEVYKLLTESSAKDIMAVDCLEPIISGRKNKKLDKDGNPVYYYEFEGEVPRFLGKGTVGEVKAVLYYKPGDSKLHYGAHKELRKYDETIPDPTTGMTPMEELLHDHKEAGYEMSEAQIRDHMQAMFNSELSEAQILAETGNPNVIGVGAVGEGWIIYESTPGAKTGLNVFDEERPEVSLLLLEDMGEGTRLSHEAGLINGDIKPENTLLLRTENGPKGVFIDPSAKRMEDGPLSTGTPEFFFLPDDPNVKVFADEARRELADFESRGKTPPRPQFESQAELNSWLARANDNRALAHSLETSGVLGLDPKTLESLGIDPGYIIDLRLKKGHSSWSLNYILETLDESYRRDIGLTNEQITLLQDTRKLIEDGANIEIVGSPEFTVRYNNLIERLQAEAKAYEAGLRQVGLFHDPIKMEEAARKSNTPKAA